MSARVYFTGTVFFPNRRWYINGSRLPDIQGALLLTPGNAPLRPRSELGCLF